MSSKEVKSDLQNPEDWTCQFWRLDSERNLKVRLRRPSQRGSLWMIFQDVIYFDCTKTWKGAKYEIGTEEECLKLAKKVYAKQIQQLGDEELLQRYRLFVFAENPPEHKPMPKRICIVATNVNIEGT